MTGHPQTTWTDVKKKEPRKGRRYIVKLIAYDEETNKYDRRDNIIVGARYTGATLWSCDLKAPNGYWIKEYRPL